jgi:heptosyltransferase II
MKILIELPTWLGDSIMATPAIENLSEFYSNAKIILIGSELSVELLKNHPKVTKAYVINKNYLEIYKISKSIAKVDLYLSFRNSFRSKYLKLLITANKKFQFNKEVYGIGHQVEKYNNFVNAIIGLNLMPGRLSIPFTSKKKLDKKNKKKILGINPGASYGNAKRWYPEKFADVAIELASEYEIVIMGSKNEISIASDIEQIILNKGIGDYQNLAGKTSIHELIGEIEKLDLFITGDSGPMHIAAAFNIPTVAIFGPTNSIETSQWMNEKNIILQKELDCQPCMKRVCPLNHHQCMKLISEKEVLAAVKSFD